MCQKWESNCGLWVLNEIIQKVYTESLKKIAGAIWELPANTANPAFPPKFGWIGCAV